jgi:hypothetical protein
VPALEFNLACVGDRGVVQMNVPPLFAFEAFEYVPAGGTWRRLPAAPETLVTGPPLAVDDVFATATKGSDGTTTLFALDFAKPVLRWRSNGPAPPRKAEYAQGAHRGFTSHSDSATD